MLAGSEFTEERLVLSIGEDDVESNVVIWQAFEVEGGKECVFSAEVSGGVMHQSWLEFHLSEQEPEDGDDYSANNLYSMNTWQSKGAPKGEKKGVGLFHTAILLPTRKDLAFHFNRLNQESYPFTGAADHGVSEALYLDDPDGNGVELYWDRP